VRMSGQIPRKLRIRKYIGEVLQNCKPGTILFTDELSRAFCIIHHGETNQDIGMALRERSDVRLERTGVWVKI